MTRLSRLAAPTASLRSMLFRPCRASFSQSRDGAYSTAKKAFLLFAEVSQGCQKSRQISCAAPALSLSWRHPRVAASTAGGGWGYPADTKTRLFYDCVPCGRADTAIGFAPSARVSNLPGNASRAVLHAIHRSCGPQSVIPESFSALRARIPNLRKFATKSSLCPAKALHDGLFFPKQWEKFPVT